MFIYRVPSFSSLYILRMLKVIAVFTVILLQVTIIIMSIFIVYNSVVIHNDSDMVC
jgi:hypothetical protein